MVGKVEKWVRQKLAAAVAAGSGQWAAAPTTVFGKPIYRVTDGSMTLTLSELGFNYEGPTSVVECRYDEIEALELAPLRDLMLLRGDLDASLAIGLIMSGTSERKKMHLPLRVYSNVATVLGRIVRELA